MNREFMDGLQNNLTVEDWAEWLQLVRGCVWTLRSHCLSVSVCLVTVCLSVSQKRVFLFEWNPKLTSPFSFLFFSYFFSTLQKTADYLQATHSMQARSLVTRWSYFGSLVIRDLTLRSASRCVM